MPYKSHIWNSLPILQDEKEEREATCTTWSIKPEEFRIKPDSCIPVTFLNHVSRCSILLPPKLLTVWSSLIDRHSKKSWRIKQPFQMVRKQGTETLLFSRVIYTSLSHLSSTPRSKWCLWLSTKLLHKESCKSCFKYFFSSCFVGFLLQIAIENGPPFPHKTWSFHVILSSLS